MKTPILALVAFALVTLLAAPAPVRAAESDPAVTVTGFVDASYSGNVDLGTDTFGMDQAEVDLTRAFGDNGAVRADLEWVKNGDTWELAVEQGYLDYVPSFAPALTVTFGRFNAPIGFEALDAPDMYQFSHSLVYEYGAPSNLTGIMLATEVLDGLEVRGYLVNGWDNNDLGGPGPKTVGGRADYSLGELGNIGLAAITGSEMDHSGASPMRFDRTVVDVDVTLTPAAGLLLGGEFNMGLVDMAGVDSDWTGVMVMGHYDFNAWAGLTGRVDWFDDPDDLVFGSGLMETRTSFTVSPTFVLGDGMGALFEVRVDGSSEDVFVDSDGEASGSTTSYAFEMTYVF